jgi:hypothetical protein
LVSGLTVMSLFYIQRTGYNVKDTINSATFYL